MTQNPTISYDQLYPEHEKLRLVKDKSQACGEFIDWLASRGIYLAEWGSGETRNQLVYCHKSLKELLGEFFEIDLTKLEEEKMEMLRQIRAKQA